MVAIRKYLELDTSECNNRDNQHQEWKLKT